MRKLDLAVEDYLKSLELEPNSIRGLFFMGRLYYEMEKLEEAKEYLQKGENLMNRCRLTLMQ